MHSWWISLVSLFAFIVNNEAQDNIAYSCPLGWDVKGISCYKLYGVADTEKQTWEKALRICQGNGAQLVRIKDYYDNERLGEYVKLSTQSTWLGMNRKGIDDSNINDAKWNTGAASSSRYEGRWADNSPDVTNGNCAYLTIRGNDYKWKFGRCEQKMSFVCERSSCPAGSFFCNNDGCISNKWKCDGEDDCGDYSDEIDCASNCRTVLTVPSGTIRSNNYPNAYTASSVCLWTIMAKEDTNVLLEIESFNTEKNLDVVDILVGGKTEATATAIAKLSGSITGVKRYRSYNNYLIVRFITDSTTEKAGFSMKYSSLDDGTPSSISLTAGNTPSVLVPPVFNAAVGLAYLGSQDYVWILTAQHTKRIVTIERIMVDLYEGDEIIIHDGDSPMHPILLSYTSANNDNINFNPSLNKPPTGPRFVSSTRRQMYIILRTAKATSGQGFRFNYWQGCETSLTSATGEIYSPGYKSTINYANYQTCTWSVNVPSGKGITLFFDSGAKVQDGKDLLEIYKKSTDNSGIAVHSGQGFTTATFASTPVIHSDNGKMFFKFTTDSVTNDKGFYGVYSVDCPDPMFNEHTNITGPQNWRYRDQITVSCKTGYSFSAEMFISTSLTLTCQFGGTWSNIIPRCQPIYCGLPPVVANGYYYNSTGVVYEQKVRYQCYPGFNMQGSELVTCQANQQWSSQPTCQGDGCSSAPQIINGQRMIMYGDLSSTASIIKYECDAGYELVGEPILFCQSDNKWSATVPSCKRLRCPLPEIMNGGVNTYIFPQYQEQIQVFCDMGYVLNGTSQLTCKADQTFGDLSWCQDINECDQGTSGCIQNCHNSIGSFTCSCNSGYTLNSNGRSCDDILECNMANNAGCDQTCAEVQGSYQCGCKTGYQLYIADGTANFSLVSPEDGQTEGDVYYIDHTCVRRLCPGPPSITNGNLLTRRRDHHYGDTVEYDCNLGYTLSGPPLLTCGSNGQWLPSGTPSCQAVTCSIDAYQTFGLIKPPDFVSPANSVEFGSTLTIYCNVPGKGTFTKERKCIFNMTSDTYHLYGNDYECGEINCGNPGFIRGAPNFAPSNTKFGGKFTFSCNNLYSVTGKSTNGATDTEVACENDGYWDFGSLQCVGPTCPDPGYPAGGSITVNRFEQNGYVSFKCNRAGFAPNRNTGIECVLNSLGTGLLWNDTVPQCVDVTKPTMTNCPSDMFVNAYSQPSFFPPTVTDNSGAIESFTVKPSNANTSLVIKTGINATVTYRARDVAGNEEICRFTIAARDEEPPRIQNCPQSRIEYVTAVGETRQITTVNRNDISVQDNGVIASVTIDPPSFTARSSSLGKQLVTVTAFDAAGNSDRCSFEIDIRASTCSPYTIPYPLHGSKSCEAKAGNTGYICNITCNAGYYLYDYPDESVKAMECNTNSIWDIPIITACVLASTRPQYSQVFDVRYYTNQNIPESCKEGYRAVIQSKLSITGSQLTATCNALPSGYPKVVEITKDDTSLSISNNQMAVHFFVTIGPVGLPNDQYKNCGQFNKVNFNSNGLDIETITVSGCPTLSLNWNDPGASFQEGFICTDNRKLAVLNSVSYCLACPEGTYITGPGTCALCPAGTYNQNTNVTTCTSCSSGTSTVTEGNLYQSNCSEQCGPGYYSSTGMPPCTQCPRNKYSVNNSTACTDCPYGSITYRPGSTAASQCYSKCSPGQFSYNGYAPNCRSCPRNFYQPNSGSTDCLECSADKITLSEGSTGVSSCVDADPQLCTNIRCQNGGTCQIINHDYNCLCKQGYYGRSCERAVNHCLSRPCYNNGFCTSTTSGYSCTCPSGTTGPRCETDLNTECQANPCQHGGVCLNRVNSFQCVCPATYTGTTCSEQSNICQLEPCLNNGNCVSYGNVRRKCECLAGYSGVNCEINIQECDSNPCYNDATCEDRINGYDCRCKSGYSGTRCETRASPCVDCSGGLCVDDYRNDGYRCVCNEGRSYGDSCGYELHVGTVPSLNSAVVENSNSVDQCFTRCGSNRDSCLGFVFNPTQNKCYLFYNNIPVVTSSDTDYNMYVKKCIRPVDDFYSPWYNIDGPSDGDDERRSQLEQYGIKVCGETDPVGAECRVFNRSLTTPDDTGDSFVVNCGINGLQCQSLTGNPCEDYEVRYRCSAYQVFRGRTCTAYNYCSFYSSSCQNSGQCTSTDIGFRCNCPSGFTGSLCQHNIDDCAKQQTPCLNGGTCIDRVNTYTCSCKSGYSGQICQTNDNDCTPYPCYAMGSVRCIDLVDDFSCECFPGYTGKNCSKNIDECASDPCLHGGTCVDGINNFQCRCPDGWSGPRCERITEKCQLNQCQNNAYCINLFDDYYCHCPDNLYGKNCQYTYQNTSQNASDICRDVNPCRNNGQCVLGVPPTCTCNNNYVGTGCETLKDHCAVSDQCKNGGTCKTGLNGVGFLCQCQPGYGGTYCEININNCQGVTCPSASTCVDVVNAYYCRCNLGLTGEDCTRALNTNYDYFFYLPTRDGYAALPYPIQLSGTSFTISLWVRFYETGNDETYFTMYSVDAINNLENPKPIVEFVTNGVNIYGINGAQTFLEKKSYVDINDGKWHNVVFVWSNAVGGQFLVDSIVQMSVVSGLELKDKIWLVLGGKLDTSTKQPIFNRGFRGYVSQLNIYNRALSFTTEIPEIFASPQRTFTGTVIRWNEFVLYKGVRPVYPSMASKDGCAVGTNCVQKDKTPPSISNCPSDIYKFSNHRFTMVEWTEPTFQGATTLKRKYRPGETFLWGRYQMTYEAIDDEGNSAFCNFNIYVQSDTCQQPDDPWGGTQTCPSPNTYSPYYGCSIGCTDANERISHVHPNLYTCGPSGSWNPKDSQRFIPLRYPPCGPVIGDVKKSLVVIISYPLISTTNCDGIRIALQTEAKLKIQAINIVWGRKLCTQDDCSDVTIVINCAGSTGRRRRATTATDLQITIPQSEAQLKSVQLPAETLTVEEVIQRSVLETSMFDFSNSIPLATLDPNGFTFTSVNTCADTETDINGKCVKCGPGTYWDSTTKLCIDCAVGTYSDQDGQTQCTPCASGLTTETTGAYSGNMCYTKCVAGKFFNTTSSQCEDCAVGYYQQSEGQFYCNWCGLGQTTRNPASTTSISCFAECPSGQELATNGNCVACPIGTYRTSGIHALCTSCPTGKITLSTGSTVSGDCSIKACEAGYKRVGTDTCEKCPFGTYQPQKWQTDCLSCGGVRYTTDQEASTDVKDCKFFCESGYKNVSLTCEACPIGTYKDNSVNKYSQCVPCPSNKKTVSTASTSENDCSIFSCAAGYKSNSAGTQCDKCPVGTYQPNPDQTTCLTCPSGTSTEKDATASANLCLNVCPEGQQREDDGTCTPCSQGFYKNNSPNPFMNCIACPADYVTLSTGATQATQCTVRKCLAGTYRAANDLSCIDCERGKYQDLLYQTSCKSCPSNTYTRATGASASTQCESFCESGKQKLTDGTCDMCERGYYKDNAVDVFSDCTLCPLDRITPSTGSTSATACSVGNCTAGYKIDGAGCTICPIGTYQGNKWQTSCTSCPPLKTTISTGSTASSDCILSCDPGYEENGSGSCTKCQIGYYKPEKIATPCTKCPVGFITANTGSTQLSECSIPDCQPGYKLVNNQCEECGYDHYQPQKQQTSCIACGVGKTTFSLKTAVAESDCGVDCGNGREINPAYAANPNVDSCIDCERGYYRTGSDRMMPVCQMCPIDFITAQSQLGTSAADCTIRNCTTPGEYRNTASNLCQPCSLGSYSNQKWQDVCQACSATYTTANIGSTSSADCIKDCPSGKQVSGSQCIDCAKGKYRNKATDGLQCKDCPTGYTTVGVGATSAADCSLSTCVAGQKLNTATMQCEQCPEDYYQDQVGQLSCKICPSGKYSAAGSTSSSNCLSRCSDPSKNNCPANSNCADDVTKGFVCTCKTNYIFINNQCQHQCDAGYCVRGSCIRDPVSCSCPDEYTGDRCQTRKSGCQPGFRVNAAGNLCERCPVGTYQYNYDTSFCIQCPSGTTTKQEAATSADMCYVVEAAEENTGTQTIVAVVAGVVGFIVIVIVAVIAYCKCRKNKENDYTETRPYHYSDNNYKGLHELPSPPPLSVSSNVDYEGHYMELDSFSRNDYYNTKV